MKILSITFLFTLISCSPVNPLAAGQSEVSHLIPPVADVAKLAHPDVNSLPVLNSAPADQIKRKRIAGKLEMAAVLGTATFLSFFVAKASDEWNANHHNQTRIL